MLSPGSKSNLSTHAKKMKMRQISNLISDKYNDNK